MSYTKHLIKTSINRMFEIEVLKIKVWIYFGGSFSTFITVLFFVSDKLPGEKTIDKLFFSILVGLSFYFFVLFILLLLSIYLNIKDNLYLKFFTNKIEDIKSDFENKLNKNKLDNENKFSQTLNLLNKSFVKIHNFKKKYYQNDIVFNEDDVNKDFMDCLFVLCINLKKIFEINNDNVTYSVSIKQPINGIGKINESSTLKTICRDPDSKVRETAYYKKTKHKIINNTAFNTSLSNTINRDRLQYYVNNDIHNSDNYRNSSAINGDNKTLQYKSELVFPLINIENDNFDCYGFICCDCNEIGGFTHQFQKDIVSGICDGLYDFLELRESIIFKIKPNSRRSRKNNIRNGNNRRN